MRKFCKLRNSGQYRGGAPKLTNAKWSSKIPFKDFLVGSSPAVNASFLELECKLVIVMSVIIACRIRDVCSFCAPALNFSNRSRSAIRECGMVGIFI